MQCPACGLQFQIEVQGVDALRLGKTQLKMFTYILNNPHLNLRQVALGVYGREDIHTLNATRQSLYLLRKHLKDRSSHLTLTQAPYQIMDKNNSPLPL